MEDPRRSLIAIDSNVFDARNSEHSLRLETFDIFLLAGDINVIVTESVWREISNPLTPVYLTEKYRRFYRAHDFRPTPEQHERRRSAGAVLTGRGRPYRHTKDAKILAEAVEMNARYFITEDRRVLNNDLQLRAVYPEIDIRSLAGFLKILDEFKAGIRR